MHTLSVATRCHACTQHLPNTTDKHPPVTMHKLHMTTSFQLVAMPTLSIFLTPLTNIISITRAPSRQYTQPMTYAARHTSKHVKSWGQPPAQSAAGSPRYTVLLILAPHTPYFPPKPHTNIYGVTKYTNIHGGTPTNALYTTIKNKT